MSKIKDNIKDVVTDVIGGAIWIATLYLVYFEKGHPWLWEGVIGMLIGSVFFLIPDDILSGYAQKFVNKKLDEPTDKK